jgi:[acyl-carrier-protein] S-malonyltransferase
MDGFHWQLCRETDRAKGRGDMREGFLTHTDSSPPERTALLFPGQGSQDREMHELALAHCPELIVQAVAKLGVDPFERMEESTAYLQPAIYCGSLALWRETGEPTASFAAGHSLGELTALTVAGYVTPEQGMRLVLARGTAMQRAADMGEPGGLLAVTGPRERALELGERHDLTLAADNAPAQIVLSGPVARLATARRQARGCGLRAIRLRVPAALHSPAMRVAVAPFRRALEATEARTPHMTVISNVTAAPFADLVDELSLGVISCVRWRESVLALQAVGVRGYREVGRSNILSGLVERTLAAV